MDFAKMLAIKVPVLFVGAAGVGKTQKIQAAFDHTETLLLSSMSEEDVGGLPYRDGAYDRRTIPIFFQRLHEADAKGKTTCLFLDEIDKAERSVADTLLTLVASRKINGNALPPTTKIVAAANPPEYGGGDGISVPMLNRFVVVDFSPCEKEWCEWALKRFHSEQAAQIVSMVFDGSIPILETVGEGLQQRTTSPRSLAMVLESIELVGVEPNIIRGLLTPNASSKILAAIQNIEDKKYNEVFKNAVKVAKTITKRKAKVSPIEL
jgi:replication-associated recombination protein RarA